MMQHSRAKEDEQRRHHQKSHDCDDFGGLLGRWVVLSDHLILLFKTREVHPVGEPLSSFSKMRSDTDDQIVNRTACADDDNDEELM